MFYNTSRYLDDMISIDNPDFKKYIPGIFQPECKLNNANTSSTETPFQDLNINVIDNNVYA